MADLETFRKMIRRYYRKTYREDGKTKHQQQDLANMIVMNEDELGKRLNGYRDEKTGRVWRLTEENVLDIVLVLAEWQALNGKQAVELLDLMSYPLETSSKWKVRLQKHFSLSELAQFPMSKETPSVIISVSPQGEQLLQPRRRLFQARDLPKGYVPRPKAFNEIKQLLLNQQGSQTTAITTALRGAGGFGKTTLALALCHDPEIQMAFPDGILWMGLGEHPPRPLDMLNGKLASLEPSQSGTITLEEAQDCWRKALRDRVCLLVIDDVWQTEALLPLLEGGPACVRLITTRNDLLLPKDAARVLVDAMESPEAVVVLCQGLPEAVHQAAYQSKLEALVSHLGCWPLLLTLANGLLTDLVDAQMSIAEALATIAEAYQMRGVTAFRLDNVEERQRTVEACLRVSLEHLEKFTHAHYLATERYQELAVFPEDTDIPLATLQVYWKRSAGLESWETKDLCIRLHRLSLLITCDLSTGMIRLHGVVRSYLIQLAGSHLPALHAHLLDAYQQEYGVTRWADLPQREGYLWQHLILHLCQTGHLEVLQTTLTDLRYLMHKALYAGVSSLEADLFQTSTWPIVQATFPFVAELSRTIVRISHLLRQARTEAEMGGLLLSHLGEKLATGDQRRELERELPRPFLTAWYPLPAGSSIALLRTLRGHAKGVFGCAVSSDSKTIVSASSDHTLKVWDVSTGTERFSLKGHSNLIYCCAMSPDGSFIVSASYDHTLKVWDAATGEERLTLIGHASGVLGCAVSPDGSFIVSASQDYTLKVWDAATGAERLSLKGHTSYVSDCVISSDGNFIVSASHDRTLKVWNAATGEELFTLVGHTDWVFGCVVSPDGNFIVSASQDCTLKVWDAATGEELFTLVGHTKGVRGCAVSPDGNFIVSASFDGTLKVWDATTGAERFSLIGHTDSVLGCAVSPDGSFIVSASSDGTLKVWKTAIGSQPVLLSGYSSPVLSCAVSPDGSFIVSASSDGTLKVWDTDAGTERFSLIGHTGAVRGCAVSPDSSFIISASSDKTLKVWDAATGAERFTLSGHFRQVRDCAVSPDGHFIVSASNDRTLKVWDTTTGIERSSIKNREYPVTGCVVSPDSDFIFSTSADGKLEVWDAATGQRFWEFFIHWKEPFFSYDYLWWEPFFYGDAALINGCAVSPDGSFIVSTFYDGTLKIWNAPIGHERLSLKGHGGPVTGCAISANGHFIVSASQDKTLKVWDVQTGQCLLTFPVDGALFSCAFHPDEEHLVACGDQGVFFLRLVV